MGKKKGKDKSSLPNEFLPVLMKHAKQHLLEEEKKGIFRNLDIEE
jgi:hypothetical protein